MFTLGSAIFVSIALSLSLYIIILRIFTMNTLKSFYQKRWGRALTDICLFATTTLFMVIVAGSSMFAMSVGAISGLLCSFFITIHFWFLNLLESR